MALFSSSWVGLDIGTSGIKVVHLQGSDEKVELRSAVSAEISPEALEAMEDDIRDSLISEAIKKLFKDSKIKSKKVVTSVSGDAIVIRPVKLPFMSLEELDGVIEFEAEQHIPLPMDQVILDYHVLGETEGESKKKLDVLLVAAQQEHVDRHLAMVAGAGLDPRLVDVDTFACANSFAFSDETPAEENVALINMGASRTQIIIVENKSLVLQRDLGIGGNDFSKEIQREFNLGLAQAEELKRQQGTIVMESQEVSLETLPDQDDRAMRISECINPIIGKLLGEIRRMFDFYETSAGQKAVHRVVLSGGGVRLKNLQAYLAENLGLAVDVANPFNKIDVAKATWDEEVVRTHAEIYGVSAGLALRAVTKKKKKDLKIDSDDAEEAVGKEKNKAKAK